MLTYCRVSSDSDFSEKQKDCRNSERKIKDKRSESSLESKRDSSINGKRNPVSYSRPGRLCLVFACHSKHKYYFQPQKYETNSLINVFNYLILINLTSMVAAGFLPMMSVSTKIRLWSYEDYQAKSFVSICGGISILICV